ncbi:transposase [Pseudomonas laurylsulfativorans]|uniref:IS110 family transposase n=1 Tax=Pseudomonas laurylsulfativorans TaxID=1943631 RepID=UPI00209F75E7|nr:IS110 family transposase [Pseudomonas laurylsulfativorans]MCP1415877.1 transposase [Pseudomonas laurylsulfativorans]MCP1417114.1 transposase [Pseudomonas laurylsulfativorans]MCP1417287.1 transposase [Pseudomonas laurylsulfativorans]MCP1417306.1 transposase [Pseudomonas laurylsulfativorans]MCP1418727.1 transposase [Pseudomonas laurylsulfativorans]
MNKVAIAAIDLGKHSFHLHAQDDRGHEILRKKFNRVTLIRYLANLEPCTIVMEACGGAHFMAQEVAGLGHTPKLIAPHLVRPYVKSNKNDFADAEAICEAATRPTMRFVPPKNQTQQALAMSNSIRESFIKDRTATVNRIHAALLEVGVSLAAGFKAIKELPALLEASSFSERIKKNLMLLHGHFNYLDGQVQVLNKDVECQAAEDDLSMRLMTMPCVGPITSTVLAAELGDGKQFKCGRGYAASIGLVPKQHSTGGKNVLLGISKRGDRNQRRLLIQCARVYLIHLERQKGALADWVRRLLASHHHSNLVVCALANKFARIAWAIAAHHTEFDAGPNAMNA